MKLNALVPLALSVVLLEETAFPVQAATGDERLGNTSAVLVELFTSAGCSSCPPADRILSELQNQPIPGVHLITLSEHVPYWNYLGWRDPYSSQLYSLRQSVYATSFHNSSTYTPQMIVDGTTEFVGSNYEKALSAIKAAIALPKPNISLEAVLLKTNQVAIRGEIKSPNDSAMPALELYVALVEDKLHSVVNRGENAGRTLQHSSVVRDLLNIGKHSAGKTIRFEKTINVASVWNQNNLRIVVFAQDTTNLRILAAAETELAHAPRQTKF